MDFIIRILKTIHRKERMAQFLVLTTFLITFILIRTITYLQKLSILPNQQGIFHIHHMVPGILFLLVSGYISLSFWNNERVRHSMAILFGIGAALTIDEFALWLFLQDVYWAKQGRDSVDAVIIATVILIIGYIISEVHDHRLHVILVKELLKK